MDFPLHILVTHGYLLLFVWVLTEQLGVPVPASPVLLAAGALTAEGRLGFALSFLAAWTAAILADSAWFFVGRRYGSAVMRFLCKLSLEPTTCVRRTELTFGQRRGGMLLFAKFVPGVATLAAPVAGQSGMNLGAFLVLDGLGAVLWSGALLGAGRFFGMALERNEGLLNWAGRFSGALLVGVIAAIVIVRILRRRTILKKLAASRLDAAELKGLLDAGEPVYIVDLRHPTELAEEGYTLPGALHFAPDALAERQHEIPRDRDVVLFCSCPGEASAAKTAMRLHKLGIERVRPLRGGYDEWKRRGFPLDAVALVKLSASLSE